MITALLIPADMQRCLNSETETFNLVAGEERSVFCCIPVIFILPVFGYLPFTSIRIFSVSMNIDRLLQKEESKTKALVFTNIQPTSSLQTEPSLFSLFFSLAMKNNWSHAFLEAIGSWLSCLAYFYLFQTKQSQFLYLLLADNAFKAFVLLVSLPWNIFNLSTFCLSFSNQNRSHYSCKGLLTGKWNTRSLHGSCRECPYLHNLEWWVPSV